MRKTTLLCASLGAVLASMLPGTSAQSQNSRSWVASYGGGTACTRSAPCAKFGDAVAATSVGGEINCVDGADFGPVTITKPLTIDCAGTGGAIGGGVSVTNFAGEIVTLRGLTIQGYEFLANGIYFAGGGELHVANCKISGFAAAPPNEIPVGINFAPPSGATAKLYVTDSVISDNGGASGGAGILIQPQTDGSARVELNRVVVENNTHGIFANGTGNGGTNTIGRIAVQIRDSAVTGSAFNGISAYTAAGQLTTVITVDRSSSNLSGQAGILAQGSPAFVVLGNATVMSNGTGLSSVNGGNILSYQNNQLTGNNTDGAPTGVLTMK